MESSARDEAPNESSRPATRIERMRELAEIDHDITLLLELAGKSIRSLGKPPPSDNVNGTSADPTHGQNQQDNPMPSTEEQTGAFKDATNAFLATLENIDDRLQQQIRDLKEAGIITLKDKDRSARPAAGSVVPTSLEPNGVGMIGNLDVGWLNSRSNKVERDMEAELWTKARSHLDGLAGRGGAGQGDGDVEMSQ